jgi:hypothetical protein
MTVARLVEILKEIERHSPDIPVYVYDDAGPGRSFVSPTIHFVGQYVLIDVDPRLEPPIE